MSMEAYHFTALEIALQVGLPISLMGEPGSGKTQWVNKTVKRGFEWGIETTVCSTREPVDFSGYPVNDNGTIRLLPVGEIVRRLQSYERAVWFFDEFSCTPPAVQAATLKVINEGLLGEVQLDLSKISFVLASNPPEQAANGWDFTPPMANRLLHFQWNPNINMWVDGMLQDFPVSEPTLLPKDWKQKELLAARGMIASFIKARPQLLQQFPSEESKRSGPWPSRRTWDFAATLYAAAESVHASKDVKAVLLGSAIGEGVAIEAITWMDTLDIPDPEEVIANPNKFALPKRGDQIFAFLVSVSSAIVRNNTPDRWCRGWEILEKALKAGHPDIAVHAAKMLADKNNQPKGLGKLPDALNSFLPILQAVKKVGVN